MTTATPTHSPLPYNSHSHSGYFHQDFRTSQLSCSPVSVGQTMPPLLTTHVRTPDGLSRDNRVPSPNYFGFKKDAGECNFSSGATHVLRNKFTPPTSNVRSAAASSPRVIPIDQNPEYEAFRKQSELARFNVSRLPNLASGTKSPSSCEAQSPTARNGAGDVSISPKKESDGQDDGKLKPRSPKRLLSSDSTAFLDRPRRNSPAAFADGDWPGRGRESVRRAEDSDSNSSSRLSVSHLDRPIPALVHHGASSEPASLKDGSSIDGPNMVSAQYVANLMDACGEDILLLDIRVSTLFSDSRINGALNLCIPTTLLKRPSFNTQKLSGTFKDGEQQRRFERWRNSKYIIVYDSNSSKLTDAAGCLHILKKFAGEAGWDGRLYIIKGGFDEFAKTFPSRVSHGNANVPSAAPLNVAFTGSLLPPVIGGCPMPPSKSAANPFFGNIRQNMDLIGGVGQLPIKSPALMTEEVEEELPLWLRKATRSGDRGKIVSEKFLQIERKEQQRMQGALSADVSYGSLTSGVGANIQLAGIEKGTKNRYNNIWPYEHSRVKLEGIPADGCDYVNANHIKALRSNKRYIATQSPIPDTFADFWNVVWQQDVRVIVMLTAEMEGGQMKAHNYWSQSSYGQIRLKFLSEHRASLEPSKILRRKDRPSLDTSRSTTTYEPRRSEEKGDDISDQPYVTVRKFTMSHSDRPFDRMREITQLQYSSWPDFGAPAHPTELLGLIEQCNMVTRASQSGNVLEARNRPLLVHCSAGCGRTGTFCAVDTVVDLLKQQRIARNARQGGQIEAGEDERDGWLKRDDEDLIESTVEDFRLQRLSMVQSLRQFVLCYESVLEWLVEHREPRSA